MRARFWKDNDVATTTMTATSRFGMKRLSEEGRKKAD
jgi:hypothetical protein